MIKFAAMTPTCSENMGNFHLSFVLYFIDSYMLFTNHQCSSYLCYVTILSFVSYNIKLWNFMLALRYVTMLSHAASAYLTAKLIVEHVEWLHLIFGISLCSHGHFYYCSLLECKKNISLFRIKGNVHINKCIN